MLTLLLEGNPFLWMVTPVRTDPQPAEYLSESAGQRNAVELEAGGVGKQQVRAARSLV